MNKRKILGMLGNIIKRLKLYPINLSNNYSNYIGSNSKKNIQELKIV